MGPVEQKLKEFQALEGLRTQDVLEEDIPFPETLSCWGVRVRNGESAWLRLPDAVSGNM